MIIHKNILGDCKHYNTDRGLWICTLKDKECDKRIKCVHYQIKKKEKQENLEGYK